MSELYEQLRDIALNDTTVYAFLKIQETTRTSDIDTAIPLIRQLVAEKKAYFDDAVNTRNRSVTPIVVTEMESK